jgi:thiosulfate/3-mercaptopyruvate sulfurtransferase
MHQMHGSKLACQVCHSVTYSNCIGCHTGTNAETGQPEFTLERTDFQFLIGLNPDQTYDRPYKYVVVRHAPIARDTFAAYGKDLLPNFDNLETWHYATPHNIQRETPQTESCNACHGNPDVFLTADKVNPDELEANRNVIVDPIPPKITSAEQLP